MNRRFALAGVCFVLSACAGGSDEPGTGGKAKDHAEAGGQATGGITVASDGTVTFKTAEFSLGPAEEKFLCYAVTAEQDLAVRKFSSGAHGAIHHFLMSTARSPEPEGYSECDVLFKTSWEPMFIATTADAEITMPEGAAKLIPEGTQIVLQLHLLNTSPEPVTDTAEVKMHLAQIEDPDPVGIFALGTLDIHLPPQQETTLKADCELKDSVHLFAMLPHMHYLGRRMELEVGPSVDELKSVLVRDPYDFDYQYIEPLELNLDAGTQTRVTCSYENDRDEMVEFGESSFNEMCFAVGFAVGQDGLSACIESPPVPDGGGVPRDPAAGECGDQKETETGVGRACTKGGDECPADMSCSADQGQGQGGGGICIQLGCEADAECGTGATCCTPPQGGGVINICIPEACRPEDCIPLSAQ